MQHIHHDAHVLLVGDAVGGLGGKFHLLAKVICQLRKQLHAGDRLEVVAPNQRLRRVRPS